MGDGVFSERTTSVPPSVSRQLQSPLHVGRPNVLDKQRFLARVEQILDSKLLSNDGPFVQELETKISELFDLPYVVAMANATLALELSLQALELSGEVIVPSFTFAATAHAIVRSGLTPVFCEITADGLVDIDDVRNKISEKTCAILPVNVYGNVCDVDAITELANTYNLKVVYDSAHVLGAKYRGKFVGRAGNAEVFSLHATKFINAFEGGLVSTSDEALYQKLRLLRNFGFVTYDTVDCVATNAKLSEIHAAMGLTNLERFSDIIQINKRNWMRYRERLPSWMPMLEFNDSVETNFQYVVAKCPTAVRDKLVSYLQTYNVLVRKYFYPGVHRMTPYVGLRAALPVTECLSQSVVCFPTGQDIDIDVIDYVCELVAAFGRAHSLLI